VRCSISIKKPIVPERLRIQGFATPSQINFFVFRFCRKNFFGLPLSAPSPSGNGFFLIERDEIMSLDAAIIKVMQNDGWQVHGACFKDESSFTAKETNTKRFNDVMPWACWIAVSSRDDREMYWLFSK